MEGSSAFRLDESERQALQEEYHRRLDNGEGFGVIRSEPTSKDQKRIDTDEALNAMSTRWMQVHQEYIDEGSEAYNEYQKEAIAREFQARPDAEKVNPEDEFSD